MAKWRDYMVFEPKPEVDWGVGVPVMVSEPKALDRQEGGDHYKTKEIQPVEYCMANGIGFMEGCVIKYVSRWRDKGGIQDLKKARHFLDMLIEYEEMKPRS